MITEIKKGDRFRCIHDVVMEPSGRIDYFKGKEYFSEEDGCITNENMDIRHIWNNVSSVNTFFQLIQDSDVTQDLTREAIEQDEQERVMNVYAESQEQPIASFGYEELSRGGQINWNAGKFTEEEKAIIKDVYENTPTPDVRIEQLENEWMGYGQQVGSRQFDTGSKRDNDDNKPLPMEMNPYMLLRYGYHMKYGQVRYGDGNWELQQPDAEVWRSMSRHFMQAYMNFRFPEQAKATDDGTDHLSAIMFGINMLMHNECVNGVEADMYFKRRNK